MFAPHLAQIQVDRNDPGYDFDSEKAHKRLARKRSDFVEQIVVGGWIKSATPKKRKSAEALIQKELEYDERLKLHAGFLKSWNEWRKFYFDLEPIKPKNRQQLTVIENCVIYAREKGLDVHILTACIHCAYKKRKWRPNFSEILVRGEQHYKEQYDNVMGDVEQDDYESKSANR